MDKYIGRLLDNRYEILEVLGTGGMAVVYKARCHKLNRLVAIKILKDDFLEDEEFRRRFHSESQAVAMLSHPNIVSIYDVSTSITDDYIVMELIDGITLKQYMEKKGVLNWKETLHFAIQIAKALEHAHSRGIVHRDIKPHNVMVLKNGSVKVTDFGIARMMSKGNTLTKEALGSVHYISPEQAKGGRVDNRSDIYSLGVVMYEMMSGRPPYDGESPVAVAIKHINGGAVMPSVLNPNIPGGLEQVIMKAMAHEPSQRYTSATKMLADMDEFRKNPGMLFDYNSPMGDVITLPPRKPVEPEQKPVQTLAEKQAQRHSAERTGKERSATPQRRSPSSTKTGAATPARRRTPTKEEQRNNTATIAIIACAFVMVVAIVVFLVMLFNGGASQKPELVEVPNLVGMVFDELQPYEDFEIKLGDKVHDNDYPEGQIISQTPEAGEQIAKGKTIYVNVSLGKAQEIVYMPNVVDWELSQAEKSLNNLSMNLRLVVEEIFDDKIPAGSVIRTEPVAETELQVGQDVVLYVSKGVEIKKSAMPDVVGKEEDIAKKVLENQDMELEVKVEEIFDSTVAAGEVIRTEPEKNQELQTGQTVTLFVSKGPELAKVPNVTGLDVDKAVNILSTAGFKNYRIEQVESSEEKDVVVKQSVEKSTEVDVQTEIILEVSKGAAPTVTKDFEIDVSKETANNDIQIKVIREDTGEVVYDRLVEKGTPTILIENQTGSGAVKYAILTGIGDDSRPHTENFDAQG